MRVPELLAPAGGPNAFLAAIAAGASAVYLGLSSYSARAAAEGFTLDDLARACRLAHGRGVRVYVAMNVLLREGELPGALATARAALEAGADALIVADFGLCRAIAAEIPGAELHLSTQAGALSPEAAVLAARELGCARVTCGRELSVGQIGGLATTGIDIECFVHGAICVCYAGACGYSAARRGRSANLGDCTQPCRMDYALVDGAGRCLAGNASFLAGAGEAGVGAGRGRARRAADIVGAGEKLLSPRDFLGLRHVAALAAAGVSSLKIEGRMKNPDYVYNVVSCYRELLDALRDGERVDGEMLDALEARLARSFNRGFTDAYVAGARADARLMSFERAINQGVRVGEVIARGRDEVTVAFGAPVAAGDTLEIRSIPGPDAPADIPRRWPMVPAPADVRAGDAVQVHCKRKVEVGSPVHLTRDAALVARAAAEVDALRSEWTAAGESVIAREARKAGGAKRAASCSGAQAFGSPASPSPSPAHHLILGDASITATGAACTAGSFASGVLPRAHASEPPEPLTPARLVRDSRAARPGDYVEAWRLREDPAAWERALPDLVVVLDEVHMAGDADEVRSWAGAAAGVVCRNLGQLDAVRELGVPFEVAAPLNVWNADAARWLAGMGAARVWLPEELAAAEVLGIARAVDGAVPLGVLTRGSVQFMVTEHCLLSAEGPCSGTCATCARRQQERVLVGRDGARVDIAVDARGRTRLYAREPRDWMSLEHELLGHGVRALHIV